MEILILFLLGLFFTPIVLTLSMIAVGGIFILLSKLSEDLDKS